MHVAVAPRTLVDALVPEREWPFSIALVGLGALAIALCAQLVIPLPWTPVPISGATLGVLYAGALLGARRGAASAALYLVLGAGGLPFFAGGAYGWQHFFGATGGYLLGFLPAAWVAGRLAQRGWDRGPLSCVALMLASSAVIFACGLFVLSFHVPSGRLLALGLYPFLPGDLAKALVSAGLLPLGWRLLGRS